MLKVVKTIAEILSLVLAFARWCGRVFRDVKIERAFHESEKTGDQAPVEKAMGAVAPGGPAVYRDGVRERPARERPDNGNLEV